MLLHGTWDWFEVTNVRESQGHLVKLIVDAILLRKLLIVAWEANNIKKDNKLRQL